VENAIGPMVVMVAKHRAIARKRLESLADMTASEEEIVSLGDAAQGSSVFGRHRERRSR
jgi:hypothetical protein